MQVAPAADRNKKHISEVIAKHIPQAATSALEIASGTGQHVACFAEAFPSVSWQPTDLTDELFGSIQAHSAPFSNVAAPLQLDASQPDSWPVKGLVDLVVCINMTHISPWMATLGLMAGAGQVLRESGVLIVYGPFSVDGKPTTDSNAQFDASLRHRNPEWGYRDVADVCAAAAAHGLSMREKVDMPANNFSLVFVKQAPGST